MRTRVAALRIGLVAALIAGIAISVTARAATGMTARGSAMQVHATGLAANVKADLLNAAGKRIATKNATALGGVVFYDVKPAAGYRVRASGKVSTPVAVHTNDPKQWNPGIYQQSIPSHGYGYLTTRDGTQLSYYVHPPTSPAGEGVPEPPVPSAGLPFTPPYPTLIEYAGYGYANPAGPESGIAILANAMGFAVVDVNMRGTGCSGGPFNFFEPLQNIDGYDVIETIARQPWVRDHKVGMMGISYGAISQLFTAQTHPPSLEAIAPLSVIDATATTLYPGGVLNNGFAVAWANERQQNAEPASPGHGQSWASKQIKGGDQTCKANQALHGMAQNLPKTIKENAHYRASVADPLDPITFVNKINVPVFMACQFQDEQTGGHCPALVAKFTGTKKKWFTFTNGVHVDALDPETYQKWYDFLSIYVAHQAPMQNASVTQAIAPVIYNQAMGLPPKDVVLMPADSIQQIPTLAGAKAAFEKQASVRVLFDNGAGTGPTKVLTPGNPFPGFEQSFSSFPVKNTVARRWYFGADGTLTDGARSQSVINSFTHDAKALPKNDYTGGTGGGDLWGNASQWHWNWKPNPAGTALAYVTAPLKSNTAVIGAGAVHLWVRSSTPDVDLQATISEIDASGHETFIQNGWIRASERKLATSPNNIFKRPSTLLEPIPSLLASDARPLPRGAFTQVVLPLYYQGHVYRAGTRIRVTIAAPNGTQPIWSFNETLPKGKAAVSIALSRSMPSSLFLPVVPGVAVPTAQPACGILRNEPCRSYVPLVNRTSPR